MLMSEPVKEVPYFTDVSNMPNILFNKYWFFLHASVRRFTYSFPTPGFIGFAQYSDVKCLTMQQIDPFSLAEMFILYSAPHTLRVTHTQTQQTHKTVRISVRVGPQYVERQETRTQALYMESHMGPPSHDLYVPLFQY